MKPKTSELKHPNQPIGYDDDGVIRFKKNNIVRTLLDYSTNKGMGLNELSMFGSGFSKEDWTQFMQLIGYSTSGYGELSQVDRKVVVWADRTADELSQKNRGKR